MPRSSILPLVFCAALCAASLGIPAQATEDETKPPALAEDSTQAAPGADEGAATQSESVPLPDSTKAANVEASDGAWEISLPMDAIAGHVAAFKAFIQKQAVDPTVEFAGSSVDVANQSVQWAMDGSAKSVSWAWDGSSKTVSWVLDGSVKSVRWVWDGSTGTLNAVVGGIGSSMGALSETVKKSAYWPANAMDKFVEDLHSDEFAEFAQLVEDTGFAVADVKVGVGIIPDLAIEFKHVRDLSDKEIAEVDRQINEYTSRASKAAGYIESVILHNLVDAGRYAGKTDLSSVSIKLFPLPGLVLKFDPFDYEEHKAIKLKSAFDLANIATEAEKKLEQRLTNIEDAIKKLHESKETDAN